jgi:hypothetical protein
MAEGKKHTPKEKHREPKGKARSMENCDGHEFERSAESSR